MQCSEASTDTSSWPSYRAIQVARTHITERAPGPATRTQLRIKLPVPRPNPHWRRAAGLAAARGRRLLDYAGMVERAAEYCHHLSENWRRSSRQTAEFARLDLVAVARDVQQVVFFSSVAIQFSGLTQAAIQGSKFELMRVFQNVFKNALEAGADRIAVAVVRAGDRIELTIGDNGAGLDADGVARALKGGFSSKKNGTGLGLSICRHLLGSHGATMSFTSTLGQGSTVRMSFPAAD